MVSAATDAFARTATTVVERERARRQAIVDASPQRAPGPWQVTDINRLAAFLVLAAVGLLSSWVGSSGTVVWSHQQAWMALGSAGVVVGAVGGMAWLLVGFRAVRVRQSGLADVIAGRLNIDAVPGATAGTLQVAVADLKADELVSAPGMTRFHRPTCQLVRGKPVQVVTSAQKSRLAPCGVCLR